MLYPKCVPLNTKKIRALWSKAAILLCAVKINGDESNNYLTKDEVSLSTF